MDNTNVFFDFVETYWADIAEFFKALIDWIKAIIGTMSGEDATEEEIA